MIQLLAVFLGALLLTRMSYFGRFRQPWAGGAASARFIGSFLVLLLLLDPPTGKGGIHQIPLVLVDHSVSLSAEGGRRREADSLAGTIGMALAFGELGPGLPGNNSLLHQPLADAIATGRPVVVITDGEIHDAAQLPEWMLDQVAIHLLLRRKVPDISLALVESPRRLVQGDTLRLQVELERSRDSPDSTRLELSADSVVIYSQPLQLVGIRQKVEVKVELPAWLSGERLLELRITPGDQQPGNDVRWIQLEIASSPAIVLLMTAPDPDGRELYRTIRTVSELPMSGYVMLQQGRWFRMDNLQPITGSLVQDAASKADLLVVRGDPTPWQGSGHARLLWPVSQQAGDWFVTQGPPSPLSTALLGIPADSLPPLTAADSPSPLTDWVALPARLSRQGVAVNLIVGNESTTGRSVTLKADGFFRWANRGGAPAQAWRSLVAGSIAWLLGSSTADDSRIELIRAVTPRGGSVQFRWLGHGKSPDQEIFVQGPDISLTDTLRFNSEGIASLRLPVGRYSYSVNGNEGDFAVEPWSPELLPGPVTLQERAGAGPVPLSASLWESFHWLILLAMAAFCLEWIIRRRIGAS